MGLGKQWTEQEKIYLKTYWGVKSSHCIANKLGRTIRSVNSQAARLGLGRNIDSFDGIVLAVLVKTVFGYMPNGRLYKKLETLGLPVKPVKFGSRVYKMVDIDKFWKWAYKNKDRLNFMKFERYGLGIEPEWVNKKRVSDWKEYNDKRWRTCS